jgi:TetR/AcrR family transcriptional repressor of nem operon
MGRFVAALQGLLPRSIGRGLTGKALATMAGLIGALMLSRGVDDPKLSDQILKAGAAVFRRP